MEWKEERGNFIKYMLNHSCTLDITQKLFIIKNVMGQPEPIEMIFFTNFIMMEN